MKRILALLLSCCLLLSCVSALAEDGTASDSMLVAEASDGLSVVSSSMYLMTNDDSSYIDCYVYAEIRNDGSNGMEIDGTLEALDAEGSVIETSYLTSNYVAPGGVAYLASSFLILKTDTVKAAGDIANVRLTIGKDPYGYGYQTNVFENATVEMATGTNFLGFEQQVFRVTITNDSDKELYKPRVIVAAYDASGKLLFLSEETFILSAGIHIPSGSTLILDLDLPYNAAQWCAQNDVSVAEVRCLVYTEQ